MEKIRLVENVNIRLNVEDMKVLQNEADKLRVDLGIK